MKIISITGATGLLGKNIIDKLSGDSFKVRVLIRNLPKAKEIFEGKENISFHKWDLNSSPEDTASIIKGSDVLVNLAGPSVGGKRWNDKVKAELFNSRVFTTKNIVKSMQLSGSNTMKLISPSGVGFYGFHGDEILTENDPPGDDFLAKLCKNWETQALKARDFGSKVCIIRTGIVLDKNEGALPQLTAPFKFFAGGWQASGKQYISWIHIEDAADLYVYFIKNELEGVFNACTQTPVTNKEFNKTIGSVMHRPCLFPVPAFAMKLLLGEFADNVINGQRVIPQQTLEAGYQFKYTDLKTALKSLIST
ncbi:TIGR01777 family oxidoreductase [soil metagenome]